MERNCRPLKERVGEGTELCAVVKANGYGHGAAACAAAALAAGPPGLPSPRRPRRRSCGCTSPSAPILVMGALTDDELARRSAAGADIAVWREGFRELCSRVAARAAAGRRASTSSSTAAWAGSASAIPSALLELARACAG